VKPAWATQWDCLKKKKTREKEKERTPKLINYTSTLMGTQWVEMYFVMKQLRERGCHTGAKFFILLKLCWY
jgi:hypothetical protein